MLYHGISFESRGVFVNIFGSVNPFIHTNLVQKGHFTYKCMQTPFCPVVHLFYVCQAIFLNNQLLKDKVLHNKNEKESLGLWRTRGSDVLKNPEIRTAIYIFNEILLLKPDRRGKGGGTHENHDFRRTFF